MSVSLLWVALVLEVLGSLVVVFEVREAHGRWKRMFRPDVNEGSLSIQVPMSDLFMTGRVNLPENLTVEERVQVLDDRHAELARDLAVSVNRLENEVIPREAAAAAREVENNLRPGIARAIKYLAEPKCLPWWLGPSLLLGGIALGGVVTALTTK